MKERKIFFVVASGGQDTDRHFRDTIETKRTIKEVSQFITENEVKELESYTKGRGFAVWGAVPGEGNIRTWGVMDKGDYIMVYKSGKIIYAAEVAMKVRSPKMAQYFWNEDSEGKTWEYIYFLINDVKVNVKQSDLNQYLGYSEFYFPRGFMSIDQKKTNQLLSIYGDLLSFLQVIESGEEPEKIDIEDKTEFKEILEEKIEKAPTEHDEMQWRLIRLGNKSHFDVWVPRNDQNKSYNGEIFKNMVLDEYQESLDVPMYIKNIDTVWKLGQSVKSAFEIEHSTSVYSGILRLSDLRSLTPNSNYPLFIVASRDRKNKVFNELRRPTFSNNFLKLDEVVHYLSYDSVRELDDKHKDNYDFDVTWLKDKAEKVEK
ncbi:MAG: hypothetical protein ABIE68_03565 [bacterium]